jgi:mannosyltransferase OCH1-like enzyme
MIPKKIHYCWLSEEAIPYNIQLCMNTWKEVMPEYELILWDRNRFDLKSVSFVQEACKVKKWAFAADYIRSYALFSEGGIYLDTDVLVKRNFDHFLEYDFFTSVLYYSSTIRKNKTLDLINEDGTSKIPFTCKPGFGIQAAVLGGIKGHPFFEDCLEFYSDKHFILNDGSFYNKTIAPDIYAMIAEKYGFRYKNERQQLKSNMLILPSEIFTTSLENSTDKTYAIHYALGSWNEPAEKNALKEMIKKVLKKMRIFSAVRIFIGKPPRL